MAPRPRLPTLALGWLLLALAGCPTALEPFDAELRIATASNQDPFADLERLRIQFLYPDGATPTFELVAPFDAPPPLSELPAWEESAVAVEIAGQVQDATVADGWRTTATGSARGFAMPPAAPIEVLLLLRGAIALLPGGLAHARADASAFELHDGRVLVFGGVDADGPVAEVEVLFADPTDPFTGQVIDEHARVAHTAFAVPTDDDVVDRYVVALGGDAACDDYICADVTEPRVDVSWFDPGTGAFEEIAELDASLIGARAAAIDGGRFAAVGGLTGVGASVYYADQPTIFDPGDLSVTTTSDDITNHEQHTATTLSVGSGAVLVTGGFGPDGVELIDGAAIWVPGSDATITGSLNQARMRHSATLLADGRVLVAGGATAVSYYGAGQALGTAELYDRTTEQFTELPALLEYPRQRHVATRLDDDRVLLCGGVDGLGGDAVLPCEIFDPVSGGFESPPELELSDGGEGMIAVTLDDGRVLLMGGLDDGNATDTVHLFVP